MRVRHADSTRVVLVMLMVLPIAVLFLLPGGQMMIGVLWLWPLLLLCFLILWLGIGAAPAPATAGHAPWRAPGNRIDIPADGVPGVIRELMDVRVVDVRDDVRIFRGPLREPPNAAFERLKQALGAGVVPYLQEDEGFGAAVMLVPKPDEPVAPTRRGFPWLNLLLLLLTLVTTTWAGAAQTGVNLLHTPEKFAAGLPYALGLMAILGIHELGHYFTARYHGMDVTPPYFIPVPFALGTFGAFIQMRSPPEDRKALFDVAVAGPIAGLVIAIPALLIGLRSSAVVRPAFSNVMPNVGTGTSVHSSILFALLARAGMGSGLQYGDVIQLAPLAFAGWLGLFITALNLLPIGQLDGGHMAHGMFGSRRATTISRVAMWTLFLLAVFVWPGLFIWAIIVFFLAGQGLTPLNDLTPVTPGRRALGYLTFLVLLLIIAPIPHSLWTSAALHCPYL